MVLKQKKYSVPSGTTFRSGSHAYRQKYFKQSTLVKTLRNCDGLNDGDDIQPGVEYSLNKKGRWNIPKEIKRNFHESEHKISLQQFHKLKREAKCISYDANSGPVLKIVPKKYYFDVGSIEPKKVGKNEEKVIGDEEKPLPEVVYSVYLPAGARSAITYNRKYIDVPQCFNGDDQHIQSAVSRKGRVAKRRMGRLQPELDDWSIDDQSEDELCNDDSDWSEGASAWGISDDFSGFVDIALQKKEFEKYEKTKSKKNSQHSKIDVKQRKIYLDSPDSEPVNSAPLNLTDPPQSVFVQLCETDPRRFVNTRKI